MGPTHDAGQVVKVKRLFFVERDPYTLKGVWFRTSAETARGLLRAAHRALAATGDMTTTGNIYRVSVRGFIKRVDYSDAVYIDLENNYFV